VVTLFPKTTCSCPARCDCYHILAAELAVGLKVEEPKRRVNLTSLCKNKRKRAEKTAGRKRPRQHVDIIPAADAAADADELLRLQNLVMSQPDADAIPVSPTPPPDADVIPESSTPRSPPPIAHRQIDASICHACQSKEPPLRKSNQSRRKAHSTVGWVQCDQCPCWYHIQCIGLKAIPDIYICDMCAY